MVVQRCCVGSLPCGEFSGLFPARCKSVPYTTSILSLPCSLLLKIEWINSMPLAGKFGLV